MEDVLSKEEKSANFQRLLDLQNAISFEKNQTFIGKTVRVLCESESKTDSERMTGRTEGGKIVNFAGTASDVGIFLDITVKDAKTWNLEGERACH